MNKSALDHIEAVVGQGKAIVSADNSEVLAVVKEAITSGRSAAFYLSREQAIAVKAWYWTPERVKASGIRAISDEERRQIESELGIKGIDTFRCSRRECECGHVYGAFEFLQQGIREHGADSVRAIFEMKNTTLLRSNPSLLAVCPNCDQLLGDGIEYDCDGYGGCCYEPPRVK